MAYGDISNSRDVIDSREIVDRVAELEAETAACGGCDGTGVQTDENGVQTDDLCPTCGGEGTVPDPDVAEELETLRALVEDIGDSAHDGVGLIRESYFEDYARELAEDIGAIKGDEGWPCNCIDWERAARELQYDYSSVEWAGVTFYVRS